MPVDTHIHTIYCGHAAENMRVPYILEAAAAKGLTTIAITEHLHQPHDRGRVDRIEADLRKEQPPVTVYIGAEIDADGFAEDGSLAARPDGLAYVLASTHHFPGGINWWYDKPDWNATERAQIIDRWFAWVIKLAANPAVDTLAHPGIMLSRNGLSDDFSGGILDGFREIFRSAAAHDTLIELNELAGKKLPESHRRTYPDLIAAARDEGCRIIMASDAHQPEAVGAFAWTLEIADAVGLTTEELAVPNWRCAPAAQPEPV